MVPVPCMVHTSFIVMFFSESTTKTTVRSTWPAQGVAASHRPQLVCPAINLLTKTFHSASYNFYCLEKSWPYAYAWHKGPPCNSLEDYLSNCRIANGRYCYIVTNICFLLPYKQSSLFNIDGSTVFSYYVKYCL